MDHWVMRLFTIVGVWTVFLGLSGVYGDVEVSIGEYKIGIGVKGPSSFRISLGPGLVPMETTFFPRFLPNADYSARVEDGWTVVEADFGVLRVLEGVGALELWNNQGECVLRSDGLFYPQNDTILDEYGLQFVDAVSELYPRLWMSIPEGDALFGSGATAYTANDLTRESGDVKVADRRTRVPYFWSTRGFSALGVGEEEWVLRWRRLRKDGYGRSGVVWEGVRDLYLSVAETMDDSTQALFNLTGFPPVPPRYVFGFMASRWGWINVTQVVEQFAGENELGEAFPLDSVVLDFEWYTGKSDYEMSSYGEEGFLDFEWGDGVDVNLEWMREREVKVLGIRKPRLGNMNLLKFARDEGWLVPAEIDGYAGRTLNFSIAAVREWYAEKIKAVLESGIDAFWNDEAEQSMEQFYWMNVAQRQAHAIVHPSQRFFSLNRAFSIGFARLGTAVWTGDVAASYSNLRRTPGMNLAWGLAGMPFVASDTGGFKYTPSPHLLTRWMQVSALSPIMRIHSAYDFQPHFPFLYPPLYAKAMRKTLSLRYQLLPLLYSLAHDLSITGRLLVRPLFAEFPDAPKHLTTQWMLGPIMAAPVLNDSDKVAILLPGSGVVWYQFNSTTTFVSPTTLHQHVPIDHIPLFVRSPAIVPLAPPSLLSTSHLPGGPLHLQIYGGGDTTFTLTEDDGISTSTSSHKTTVFTWNDTTNTLTWQSSTPIHTTPTLFQAISISIFRPNRSIIHPHIVPLSLGRIQL